MSYGTQRFSAAFSRALRSFLSWAESIQFLLFIPISLRSILILASHLYLGLPKSMFIVGLAVKILKVLLPIYILATWPAHLKLLDLITLRTLCERHKLLSSSLWSLLQSPFRNILLRILFSNTLSLHSSLNVRDHVQQPNSTNGNIIVYIFSFSFSQKEVKKRKVFGLKNNMNFIL